MSSVDYASPQKAGAADPNAQKRNEAAGTLGFKEKLGYGLGDTASHFVWDMVGFWLLFFYTDVYKIPAAAAGTIMLVPVFIFTVSMQRFLVRGIAAGGVKG